MPIRIENNRIYFNDNSWMDTANIPNTSIPSGTVMFFQQSSAPPGWTKITTYNDYALRLVNGTVGVYSSGQSFTTCLSSSRSVSGSVSISVDSHSSSTNNSSSSVSLSSSTISGFSFNAPTVNNSSGSENFTIDFSGYNYNSTTTDSSVPVDSWIGISQATPGIDSHSHSTPDTEVSSIGLISNQYYYDSEGILEPAQNMLSSVSANSPIFATTGSTSLATSTHEHGSGSISFSGTHNHSYTFNHSHSSTNLTLPQHSHSGGTYSASLDSNGLHGHTVTQGNHSHSFSLSHSASGSFLGNPMSFAVSYVDLILASKD